MPGYSTSLIEKNKRASGKLPGVKLGRYCIKNDISVTRVSHKFKVSRQTIYNWFVGKGGPSSIAEDWHKWL